jgi:hypothetical protein
MELHEPESCWKLLLLMLLLCFELLLQHCLLLLLILMPLRCLWSAAAAAACCCCWQEGSTLQQHRTYPHKVRDLQNFCPTITTGSCWYVTMKMKTLGRVVLMVVQPDTWSPPAAAVAAARR